MEHEERRGAGEVIRLELERGGVALDDLDVAAGVALA
jgi:hypothetical protein